MSLLDAPNLFTFSNKPVFDEVRPLTFDVSSAFEDVSLLTFDVSSAFEDVSLSFEEVSLLTFDVSSAFEDVSLSFEDVSLSFEEVSLLTFDVSSTFEDLSARISLACPFIIPSISCRNLSMVLSRGAAASGSGLVSVQRPIPCGFKGTLGLFDPPAGFNFLLPSSSVIERLAIPATTFSLFPIGNPADNHDDGIPYSTMYSTCGFLRVRVERVVVSGTLTLG